MDQYDMFSENAEIPIPVSPKVLKIKKDITTLTDKHWDTGLLSEHRSLILVQELKAKGYTKKDFENIQIPVDTRDKYDYGFLVQDILFYFDSRPISIENAQEIFYTQKIIPNTIGSLHFINSGVRKHTCGCYGRHFVKQWRFFHGKSAHESLQKLELHLEKYVPNGDFDILIRNFYQQFIAFINAALEIKSIYNFTAFENLPDSLLPKDSDEIQAIQEHIKNAFDGVYSGNKGGKKKQRINKQTILRRMKSNIDYKIFKTHEPETKMILGGHYRNEIPGSYDWTAYHRILLNLIENDTVFRDGLKIKHDSRLLPNERKNDGINPWGGQEKTSRRNSKGK
jgi:hypothetical protein